MRLVYIRRIVQAPWHCWLKEAPFWKDVFAELLSRLPSDVLRKLSSSVKPLVVLPPARDASVFTLSSVFPAGVYLLQLHPKLSERPSREVLGILAHEIAHLCTDATDDPLSNDLRADQKAASDWGFESEVFDALSKELESTHPRITALKK